MSKWIVGLVLVLVACAWPQSVEAQPKSSKSNTKVDLTFSNQGSGEVELFWVDYDGADTLGRKIAGGAKVTASTSSNHVWKVVAGKKTATYTTTGEPSQTLVWTGTTLVQPSRKGGKNVTLQVKNNGKGEIEAIWIDWAGAPKSFDRKINPGNSIDIVTGPNQTWFLKRADGSVIGYYRTTATGTQKIAFTPGSGLVIE